MNFKMFETSINIQNDGIHCTHVTADTERHSPNVSHSLTQALQTGALNDLPIFFSNSVVDYKADSELLKVLPLSFQIFIW